MIQRVGLVKKQLLYDLADIVRAVSGSTGTIQVAQLAAAISTLSLSGEVAWTSQTRADGETFGVISEALLIDIADAVRLVTGTIGAIRVDTLASVLTNQPEKEVLAAPVIALVDVEVDAGTSAVLGVAILGQMVLGNSGGGTTKDPLTTPVISIVELGEALAAPNIELVEV